MVLGCRPATTESTVLPSWNAGATKEAIIEFVTAVTTPTSPDFVAPAERVAVFDNDGTLWAEQPTYVQIAFAADRLRLLAPDHPEWNEMPLVRAVLDDDAEALQAAGTHGLLDLVILTHANNTTDEFAGIVDDWISTATHPETGRRYTEMVYQPMVELLDYLRSNDFKTYIVSGGGVEFMRPWTERVYGIPPEQVIGSSVKTEFALRDNEPVLLRLPEMSFVDDGPGKPVAINLGIGRRPIAAFGNSDGDLQMLQWVDAGSGRSFCLYVHHTDAEREWRYDRESGVGRLAQGLEEARTRGWTVVDMQRDWNKVFPFDGQ